MIVYSLTTEYQRNPLGIDTERPRFSWKLGGTQAMQTAYSIVVSCADGEVWNSGRVDGSGSVCIEYAGEPLSACTRYEWSVAVYTDDAGQAASERAYFETGLMSRGFGDARFIMQNGGADETGAPAFRKEFEVKGSVVSARLYATCAGVYDAYINGKPVSEAFLNPGRSEYTTRVMYQTFDVTALIKPGVNVVGSVLGRGWYIGAKSHFGGVYPAFMGLLSIKLSDESEQTVITDGSWAYSADGPIIENDIFNGERYDARRELNGWCEAGFDAAWRGVHVAKREYLNIGEPTAQLGGVVLPMCTLKAVEMTQPENGVYVYDFGQNLTGVVRIKARGERGRTLVMRHGEMLNDADSGSRGCDGKKGTLYTTNLRSAEATDMYTFKGNQSETYCPRFTYHGFRYVELSGVDIPPALDDVEAVVLYSEMEDTGTLETSDKLINRFIENVLWGQRGNFLSVPTDCPQRDERMGWSGDAQVFCGTACYNSDAATFYEKYLVDLNDCVHENGAYPDVAPATGRKHYGGSGNSGWGDAGIVIPWILYNRYNDVRVLEENYGKMCKYIDFLYNIGGKNHIKANSSYGDWLSIGETTPVGITDTAYCAYVFGLMSKIALLLEKGEDSALFSRYAREFSSAWCREFLKPDGSTRCDTQTSYVVGLYFDIIPDNLKAASADCLVRRIQANGGRITTGFLGANLILPVLCDTGHEDVALLLLEQREYPSWLYPVLQGATTIWERWNSYTIENGFADAGMNSFNHYAYGSAAEWLYSYLAGIRCDGAAFKKILLKPVFGGSLSFVSASYNSMYGMIKSAWRREDGAIRYSCTVPCNTTARLCLPGGETHVLKPGDYEFKI